MYVLFSDIQMVSNRNNRSKHKTLESRYIVVYVIS